MDIEKFFFNHGYSRCVDLYDDLKDAYMQDPLNKDIEDIVFTDGKPDVEYVVEQAGALDGEIFGFGPWDVWIDFDGTEGEKEELSRVLSSLDIDTIFSLIRKGHTQFIKDFYD